MPFISFVVKNRIKGLFKNYETIKKEIAKNIRKKGAVKRMDSKTRKSRTRTLIQMGGLVEKSGLMNALGLQAGDDLQKDSELFDKVSCLLGAFLDASECIQTDGESQEILWSKRGKEHLSEF